MNATGDVVTGDVITWTEGVFGGSYRSPEHMGDRTITAIVLKDSYGVDKQQHTFTVQVLHAEGYRADEVTGRKNLRRKGRNIYRNGTERLPWQDEAARNVAADEKHARGTQARRAREFRNAQDRADIEEIRRLAPSVYGV